MPAVLHHPDLPPIADFFIWWGLVIVALAVVLILKYRGKGD